MRNVKYGESAMLCAKGMHNITVKWKIFLNLLQWMNGARRRASAGQKSIAEVECRVNGNVCKTDFDNLISVCEFSPLLQAANCNIG